MKILVTIIVVQFSLAVGFNPGKHVNTFEATHGCLQYSTKDACSAYLSTNKFKHMKTSDSNVTIMRMGVMAAQGPHIRLSPIEYPYDIKINEIVLSAWDNTASEMRSYIQKADGRSDFKLLKRISNPGLLSEFSPMMFTLEIDQHGSVKLTKDGAVVPLVEFQDRQISFGYMQFCKYMAPATFFFDCPLEVDHRDCTGIVLR